MRKLLLLLICAPVWAQTPTFNVTLQWTPPTTNADGSTLDDLSGFNLYWGVTDGGPYPNMLDIGNPVDNSFILTDQALLGDTLYHFVMTAYDDAGNESALSNQASTTTPDNIPPGPPVIQTVTIRLSGAKKSLAERLSNLADSAAGQ